MLIEYMVLVISETILFPFFIHITGNPFSKNVKYSRKPVLFDVRLANIVQGSSSNSV